MAEARDPIQEARDMQQRFRNVFGSTEGRRVLGEILTWGHFGETLDTPTAMAENNFAVAIARMAGVFDPLWKHVGLDRKGD